MISEALLVMAFTNTAMSWIEISLAWPMLKTSPWAFGMLDQGEHGADDVTHPGQRAPLRPVAVDWDRLASQGEADQRGTAMPYRPVWPGPMVLKRHATTVGSPFSFVGLRAELVDPLRGGVAPAGLGGRPQDHIVLLAELRLAKLAVNLRG
jgi:hypothetical protein